MNKNPQFSIVIPTRERSNTLKHTISTVLSQSYKDFELVIMDNFSQDQTKEVVFSFQDERIKYYCSEKRLSMMDNWELALSYVNGEYSIFIGDDDALIPDCLMLCEHMLRATPHIKAIKWNNDNYSYWWPDALVESNRNMIFIKFINEYTILDSHVFLSFFCNAGLNGYSLLPSVYHGLVQTEFIKNIQNKFGKYFNASAVDIYSGIINAYFLDKYILSNYSFSINGVSGKSNGTAYLFNSNKGKEIREEAKSEYNVENITKIFHPELKNKGISNTLIWCFDSFLRFKELLSLENDPKFTVNRVNLLNTMTYSIKFDYDGYEKTVEEIKSLAKMWNINQSEIQIPPKVKLERPKTGPVLNGSGNISGLAIDGNILGISNIYEVMGIINSLTAKNLIFKKEGIQIG